MTWHQCPECGGEGGWTYEDGTKQNCPDCHGWGNVDDGQVDEDDNYGAYEFGRDYSVDRGIGWGA